MKTRSETVLIELLRYNNWANQEVLAVCQRLDDAQLAATTPGTFGTIRETIEHIVRSEAGYLYLITGNRLLPPFNWDGRPSLAEIKEYAVQLGQALLEAAEQIPLTKRLLEDWQGQKLRYTTMIVFMQAINHGIEHRTNITTTLSQGQLTPPGVDGWGYYLANRDRLDME
jgi:uncharacterized damage-inducible protein DinB